MAKEEKTVKLDKFGRVKLPTNILYSTWGRHISPGVIVYKDRIYNISNNKIQVYEQGQLLFTFSDEQSTNTKYDFVRLVENQKYYVKDNKIVLITKELPTKYLAKLKTTKVNSNPKIITFDIETLLIDNIHKPYLYSMYDGVNSYSWFTDSPEELFNQILRAKYKNYIAYAHNLSRFDVVFIFKYLSTLKNKGFNIKLLIRDQQIIEIKIITDNFLKLANEIESGMKKVGEVKDLDKLLTKDLAELSANTNPDGNFIPEVIGESSNNVIQKPIPRNSSGIDLTELEKEANNSQKAFSAPPSPDITINFNNNPIPPRPIRKR